VWQRVRFNILFSELYVLLDLLSFMLLLLRSVKKDVCKFVSVVLFCCFWHASSVDYPQLKFVPRCFCIVQCCWIAWKSTQAVWKGRQSEKDCIDGIVSITSLGVKFSLKCCRLFECVHAEDRNMTRSVWSLTTVCFWARVCVCV